MAVYIVGIFYHDHQRAALASDCDDYAHSECLFLFTYSTVTVEEAICLTAETTRWLLMIKEFEDVSDDQDIIGQQTIGRLLNVAITQLCLT